MSYQNASKFCLIACLWLATCLLSLPLSAQTPKGHLVIIGGGTRPVYVMQKFIDLAGGSKSNFLVISTASEATRETGEDLVNEFKSYGVTRVQWVAPTRAQSNDPSYVALLKDIDGIYFSGGDQNRITDSLRGSLFHKELTARYLQGAVIGGTSAGAAMMSSPMLTGGHKDGTDGDFNAISAYMVETVEGMGFIKNVIIDQHFIKRQRQNRLFSVALEHPQYISMGIDESTALIVSKGNRIEVLGESSVMVVEPGRKPYTTDKNGHLGSQGFTVKLLLSGDTYRVK